MKKEFTVGVDVGNSDTKTQSVTIPSGFEAYNTLPYGAESYLEYNGMFYVPKEERFTYQKDKTVNENAFILSLLAISEEILLEAKKQNDTKTKIAQANPAKKDKVLGVQGEIDTMETLRLGVGVPPTHMAQLSKKMEDYYKDRMSDGIEYVYNGYKFSYSLSCVQCFPQDFAAIITYKPKNIEESAVSYQKFYAIDIGGWTVDVVTVVKNKPTPDGIDSKPLGVLSMYEDIIKKVELTKGKRLDRSEIEYVLRGQKTLISEEIKDLIISLKDEWYKKIKGELITFGVKMDSAPLLFIGGGSQIFKSNIKADKDIAKSEFVPNQRANAIAYATIINIKK